VPFEPGESEEDDDEREPERASDRGSLRDEERPSVPEPEPEASVEARPEPEPSPEPVPGLESPTPVLDPDPEVPSDDDAGDASGPLPPARARELAAEAPRSFFAQPDPLKWIVGGANSLRIVPSSPHEGQNSGPGSLRPWRMSVRWSQAVQAYS